MSRLPSWMGCALLTFLAGCDQAPPPAPPAKPAVVVTTVGYDMVTPNAEFVGRTQASEDVKLQAQVSGPLLRRDFKEGDQVEKGQLLFEIDPAPFKAALSQQQAILTQARAALSVAERNYNRGKQLHPQGMISDSDMDQLTSNKDQAAAKVVQAQSAVDAAQLQLDYTRIEAPISGRISASLVSIGDLISPQVTLATLVQLDPMWVNFQASEQQVANARQARLDDSQKPTLDTFDLRLLMPNGNPYERGGSIEFVDNRVDSRTGTINLRASFPNPDGLLLPGMYVTVTVSVPTEQQVILIPQASVQEDQQGRFVMVVGDGNKVVKRLVTLGDRYGVEWQVVEGLQEGERIVVEGLQKIRAGIEVQATEQTIEPFQANQ
ncbi:efflux RND transporter periplasmic adaptor subunit [Motiliproteus sediminis]|uniref:efflux RND transporter periplasmic adaptor subunit n=1 Tax=Motiliproteus sediminis TaxID=1468178 RepID=UPI001AEFC019|nr:efflux RND transporter periplasmic adaptor subunit [Motiliproteus sediminis]